MEEEEEEEEEEVNVVWSEGKALESQALQAPFFSLCLQLWAFNFLFFFKFNPINLVLSFTLISLGNFL